MGVTGVEQGEGPLRAEGAKFLELELKPPLENWGLDFQGGGLIQRYPLIAKGFAQQINVVEALGFLVEFGIEVLDQKVATRHTGRCNKAC